MDDGLVVEIPVESLTDHNVHGLASQSRDLNNTLQVKDKQLQHKILKSTYTVF